MLTESLYLSALLMGLLGSTHCAGMCGGIVSALTLGSPRQQHPLPYLIAYNSGRIASYIVAGALIATVGGMLSAIGEGMVIRQGFALLSGLLMILLGLYLSGWWPRAILIIERGGSHLWKLIEPLAKRWIPIRSIGQATVAGALWGWLPCGLVYTALLWALSAESTLQGAIIMASFGIGTLPALMGLGLASHHFSSRLQQPWLRQLAGIMVISFGIYQLTTV